jgi:hypothetical protein
LTKLYSDAVAVEMEGRGFLEGVHLNADVRGGVIRGISDLLDRKAQADKAGSQQRAADATSATAFEILTGLDSRAAAVAPAITFKERPSTFSKAAFFKKGEVLAQVSVPNVDQVSFSYANGPDCYLRLMPAQNLARPLALTTLKEVAGSAPLLRPSGFNGLITTNKHGAIRYDFAGAHRGGPAPLRWATQLFQNGELWRSTDTLIVRERGWRPAHVPIPLLPTLPMGQAFYTTLYAAVAFAVQHMGLTLPAQVEVERLVQIILTPVRILAVDKLRFLRVHRTFEAGRCADHCTKRRDVGANSGQRNHSEKDADQR